MNECPITLIDRKSNDFHRVRIRHAKSPSSIVGERCLSVPCNSPVPNERSSRNAEVHSFASTNLSWAPRSNRTVEGTESIEDSVEKTCSEGVDRVFRSTSYTQYWYCSTRSERELHSRIPTQFCSTIMQFQFLRCMVGINLTWAPKDIGRTTVLFVLKNEVSQILAGRWTQDFV